MEAAKTSAQHSADYESTYENYQAAKKGSKFWKKLEEKTDQIEWDWKGLGVGTSGAAYVGSHFGFFSSSAFPVAIGVATIGYCALRILSRLFQRISAWREGSAQAYKQELATIRTDYSRAKRSEEKEASPLLYRVKQWLPTKHQMCVYAIGSSLTLFMGAGVANVAYAPGCSLTTTEKLMIASGIAAAGSTIIGAIMTYPFPQTSLKA